MKGAPRSSQFDDIYFSAEDGLAETRHVFFYGNDLPHAWEGKDSFTIAETGFGTGLNFLAVWSLFEENATPSQTLDFISVEKYPLTPAQISAALKPWKDELGDKIDILTQHYPLRINGFHRIKINQQITLTLIFDDIADAFPQVTAAVDCWFLDGFTPAKNPDMWSSDVFEQMARLSKKDASFATFTAAGDVRRGLQEAGFSIEKKKGFGHKRDMIVGRYLKDGMAQFEHLPRKNKIAIIGGGLAGTACGYVLKQYGYEPVIYEASHTLASGASGNERGFFNPRFSKHRDSMANFFIAAYAQFIRLAHQAGEDIEYNPCGALHLMTSPDKKERFDSVRDTWGWHEDHMRFLDKAQASEIAGIPQAHDALFLPDSGSVSPQKLCAYYARDIEVRYDSKIEDLEKLQEDVVIICNASQAASFDCLSWLELEEVRGQVSKIRANEHTAKIKCNIHYGGYLSAFQDGSNVIGATFQKWIRHTEIREEDHERNFHHMEEAISFLKDQNFNVLDGWAGMRTASNDRFPVVGAVPESTHIFLSCAFGSYGLVGTLAAAHYIADIIRGGVLSLPQESSNALCPQRFIERMKKKQGTVP